MPQPPKTKTGYDYAPVKRKLQASGFQQVNQAAFDAIFDLIKGAEAFQGSIDNLFPTVDGSTSSLLNAVRDIIEELNDRNNSKYSVSLTNSQPQLVPSGVKTKLTF